MTRPPRLHITGAPGSGTTTLGRALAARLRVGHLDTDHFLWEATDPPYQRQHSETKRRSLLEAACNAEGGWVLSGAFLDWGDPKIPPFDLVVFLFVPTAERIARLRLRETETFGREAVQPGGAHHEDYTWFLEWAAAYDGGKREGRSLPLHEAWLAGLSCPVLRIAGVVPLEDAVSRTLAALDSPS